MIRNKARRHLEPPKLNLTAMVDVFTVLLVFLLKSYSSQGTFTANVPVNLPSSTVKNSSDMNLVVIVTDKELFLENSLISDPSFLSTESPEIPKLNEAIGSLLKKNNLSTYQKKVTIWGDRTIPYYTLKKVIYTFVQNGFSDISLAVRQKGNNIGNPS